MSNILTELEELRTHTPALDAPVFVVAAWYEAKAVCMEHLGKAEEAVTARAHAARLLGEVAA